MQTNYCKLSESQPTGEGLLSLTSQKIQFLIDLKLHSQKLKIAESTTSLEQVNLVNFRADVLTDVINVLDKELNKMELEYKYYALRCKKDKLNAKIKEIANWPEFQVAPGEIQRFAMEG